MAADINDFFTATKTAGTTRPVATTLSAQKLVGATSASIQAATGWETGTAVHGIMYRVDANNTKVAGSQIDWKAVVSGTTLNNFTVTAGTDDTYAIGAVVELAPTAAWADDLVNGITVAHEQTGIHKAGLVLPTPKITTSINDANGNEVIQTPATASAVNEITVTNAATGVAPVISATGGDSAINLNLRGKGLAKTVTIGAGAATIFPYDYVVSGCAWSGDAYASTRNASMTSGVVVINGNPITVATVTARLFTASKDTYVDVLDNGDGTGLLVYTEVANNAASPALASNSVRLGIIVTGATNIADAGSVNQGQETKVLPIASSVPYAVTDSLGNLICPRDPQRRVLGYRQITANVSTTSTSATQITGLTIPFIVPTNRKVKVTVFGRAFYNTTNNVHVAVAIWDGTVGSGSILAVAISQTAAATGVCPLIVSAIQTTSGSKTYNISINVNSASTGWIEAASNYPTYAIVELV